MMGNTKYKVGDKVTLTNGDTMTVCQINDTLKWYFMKEDPLNCYTDEMIEGLVERNGKTYPYKIGDRVILKGNNRCATITDLKYNSWGNLSYYIKIDNDKDISVDYPTELLLPYDNMIEEIAKEKMKSEDELLDNYEELTDRAFKGGYEKCKSDIELNGFQLPEGYIFKDENGNVINATKIVLEKKKKEYPKTYEECCKILGVKGEFDFIDITDWEEYLYGNFICLKRCRDAYWKLYGKEMGLNGPWEPTMETVYCISRNNNVMKCSYRGGKSNILEFPTEEMRDAFYENFKEEIENCKEFL